MKSIVSLYQTCSHCCSGFSICTEMIGKLRSPTMISYGTGQIAEAIKNSGFNVFLLFYYNQVLGISATATSIALAIALVFDAFTDPLAGSLSDKYNSRWGQRHPFIFFSAFPLALTFFLLFNPPGDLGEFGLVLWLGVFAILVRASMTFYHVPHLALGAELAEDYDQRSTLYSFSVFLGYMGGAIFVPLSYRVFFPTTQEFNPALLNEDAYFFWSLFAGVLMILAIFICVYGTRSEIPRLRSRTNKNLAKFDFSRLYKELSDAFSNSSFQAIFFGMILCMFIISVEGVLNPFMGFHFWEMTTEQLSFFSFGQLAGLILSVFFVPFCTTRFDKKATLIGCALAVVVIVNVPIVMVLFDFAWFPQPGSTALLAILVINTGITTLLAIALFATINSMFADITDEHELEIGERREGIIFSARSFANKATASVGLVFGGILLDYIAFPRGAVTGQVPEDIVWQLGFIAGPATSVFTVLGLLLFLRYKINRKRHGEIVRSLNRE
ncbi:MAG: hypothetical protein CMQ40_02410 [Gammaproteobacteria bacterium]|nr:hypothetical protein [Gammaproteobacteria bacterium]